MAEVFGEPVSNQSGNNKEPKQIQEREEFLGGSSLPRSDYVSDLRIDFKDDQEPLSSDFGHPPYRGPASSYMYPSKAPTNLGRNTFDRRYEMHDPEYYGRYDSMRNASSRYYDVADESFIPSSLHEETLSPRSRYDLAYSPRQSRYGSHWDHYDDYGPLSPRYKENRWNDYDNRFNMNDDLDSFSPSFSRPYPSEFDAYPSSYPYSSPLQRFPSPNAPHPMNMRTYDPYDNYMDDYYMECSRYPFSNPTSPQPGYGAAYPHLPPKSMSRGNHSNSPMESMLPASSASPKSGNTGSESPCHTTGSSGLAGPAGTPSTGANPANGNTATMEEGSEREDESYRIDSKKIMQNLEERTVVLIRNIPNRYKLEDLQQVISSYVDEEYTVLRLPIDAFTKRNLGYAFVSFSDSHEVLKLFLKV